MIQWEEVELKDATHVEINGKIWELTRDGNVKKSGLLCSGNFRYIDILIGFNKFEQIHVDLFPFLGIKPLRKPQPKPIEFEATFVMYDGCWQTLHSLEDRFPDNCKKATFRCVEILEDEE
jgi:hypothetical protein